VPPRPAVVLAAQAALGDQVHAFAPTAPMSMPASLGQGALQVPPAADAAMAAAVPSLVADAEPFEHDPDLEEAAIRFASGDFEGAEAGLREIMTQPPQDGARPDEVWLALFDLYRATGQQDPFDMLAIEFAARFGRSAPLWFSLPEQLGIVCWVRRAPKGSLYRNVCGLQFRYADDMERELVKEYVGYIRAKYKI